MQQVLVLGAGKIGTLIGFLLRQGIGDYNVHLCDINIDTPLIKNIKNFLPHVEKLDATNPNEVEAYVKNNKINIIISALPYNIDIIEIAKKCHTYYFDLTEDIETALKVKTLAAHSDHAFIPQCGLAPGFVSIVTHHLQQHFSELDTIKMRVGALPENVDNALQYSLTWSTDGLINEYGNTCHALQEGKKVDLAPLEGLEEIKIDGLTYEAFNTSGGIGSLVETYEGKVKNLNYKTIRYPGHCEKMAFLMKDLQLNDDRETLKKILEKTLPKTYQDLVLLYISVTGIKDKQFCEQNYVKKFYPEKIGGILWSAIQLTTATSLCAVLDIVMTQPGKYKGLVKQEEFKLEELLSNRFGQYLAKSKEQSWIC